MALWHAVHDSWPFAGDTPAELAAAIAAGRLTPPARRTPDWLRAALTRGLATDPEARWPLLDDLLRVLGRDRSTRRWWIGAALVAVAVGAALWLGVGRGEAADPCAGAGAASRFAGIWDGPRKAAVQGAFYATGLLYADDTWQRVNPRIDSYVAAWSRMATETCRATRVEGRQSDTLMDLRMRCLDERRSVLGALTELWMRSMDGRTLERAVDAAHGLPPISECANERALRERTPSPTDPVRARMVEAVRPKLDALQALLLASRWAEARQRAPAVRAEADATGWPQLQAEAALAEGRALTSLQERIAERPLLDAVRWAGAAHDDDIAARALSGLVRVVGLTQHDPERGLQIAEIAEGAVLRAGDTIGQRMLLMRARGYALRGASQYRAAKDIFTKVRAECTAAFGPDDPETLSAIIDVSLVMEELGEYDTALALNREVLIKQGARLGLGNPVIAGILRNIASISDRAGDLDTAADYYRRCLELNTKVLGSGAVEVARCARNLGAVEVARGRFSEAEVQIERGLDIAEHVFGLVDGFVAQATLYLGELRRKQGRYREALDLLNRAELTHVKVDGPDNIGVADTAEGLASLDVVRGELTSAFGHVRRALEIRSKVFGNDHPIAFQSMAEVAAVLARMQRCAEARRLLDAALAGFEKTKGTTQWGYQLALATIGECELAGGAVARAAEHAERAVALARGAKEWPVGRGQYRWVLVRALWALGRRDEAIAAARQAERELAADADGAIDRAAVRAWLAIHAGAARASERATPPRAP